MIFPTQPKLLPFICGLEVHAYANSPRLSGSLLDTKLISQSPVQFTKSPDKREFVCVFIKDEKLRKFDPKFKILGFLHGWVVFL